jgi:hypothetical protein
MNDNNIYLRINKPYIYKKIISRGLSFNPVPVSIKNKNNNEALGNGDRVLISLLNNCLEVYHIQAPDTVIPQALIPVVEGIYIYMYAYTYIYICMCNIIVHI